MQDIACISRNDREQDNVIEGRIVSPSIYIERCNVSRCASSKFGISTGRCFERNAVCCNPLVFLSRKDTRKYRLVFLVRFSCAVDVMRGRRRGGQ